MNIPKIKVKYSGLVGEMAKYGHKNSDLGKLLGLDHSAISRRLSGQIEWSIGEIEKICDFYQKDYYQLFTDKGE